MIVQVKEKFGSVRIYFEPNQTAYEDLLDQLAAESLTVCEVWGARTTPNGPLLAEDPAVALGVVGMSEPS